MWFRSSHFSLSFRLPLHRHHHSSPFWARGVAATDLLESVSGMRIDYPASSRSSVAVSSHVSHPYNRTGRTKVLNSFIFVFRPMLRVFEIFFRLKNAPRALLRRFLMSSVPPPFIVTVAPRYTNSSTSSTSYLPIITVSSLRVFILITLHLWAFSFSPILPVLSTSRLVLFRMCSYFDETTILDRIKREQLTPLPLPQSNDKGAKERQTRHFGVIEMGGSGGSDVPFLLSKIIGLYCLQSRGLQPYLWSSILCHFYVFLLFSSIFFIIIIIVMH